MSSPLPQRIEVGARVAVVAPSGPMYPSALEPGLRSFREAGFELVLSDDLLRGQGTYLAGSDARRTEELVSALRHPDIAAVVCARGGYGAMRLLPALAEAWQADGASWRPKLLTGFSDVTALHAFALTRLGWPTLHCAMPFNFGRPPTATASS